MRRKFAISLFIVGLACGGSACSQRLPLEEAGQTAEEASFTDPSAPLDLRQFEVVASGGGYRGVFLKLSRFPDSVVATQYDDPARIVVDVRGPTGTESAEEAFPGNDSLVNAVRVSREIGLLRIVLDIAGDHSPDYTLHRMADWIMIRIPPRS